MADYFIAINDQQQGPYPAHELPGRGMRPESRVWCEGMPDWQRADSVAELIPLLPGRQPPAASAPVPVWPAPQPPQYQQPWGPAAPPTMGYAGAPVYYPGSSNRVAAGLCGIFLGALGVHKFILGQTGAGIVMLLFTVLTCFWGSFIMGPIGLIEGIIYLSKSDAEFHQTYVVERRSWF